MRVGQRLSAMSKVRQSLSDRLEGLSDLQLALDETEPGRVEDPDSAIVAAFATVRDAARAAVSGMTGKDDPDATQAAAAAKETFDVAGQLAALAEHDVIWVGERERFGRQAYQAPLSVAGLIAEHILGDLVARLPEQDPGLGVREEAHRDLRCRGAVVTL